MTDAELLQNLILIFGGIFGTAVAGIIIYHYTKKADCFTALKQSVYASKEDISLIKKFLVAQSRIIDAQTKRSHPKECLELEELARQMLDEE